MNISTIADLAANKSLLTTGTGMIEGFMGMPEYKNLQNEEPRKNIPVRSYVWLGVTVGLAFLCLAVSIFRIKWLGR